MSASSNSIHKREDKSCMQQLTIYLLAASYKLVKKMHHFHCFIVKLLYSQNVSTMRYLGGGLSPKYCL